MSHNQAPKKPSCELEWQSARGKQLMMQYRNIQPSRTLWLPQLGFYDVLCSFVAPCLVLLISNSSITVRTVSGNIAGLWYIIISFAATLASLLVFRVGADLWEHFSPADSIRIAKAAICASLTICAAIYLTPDGDYLPGYLPAFHFFVLTFLLVSGRTAQHLFKFENPKCHQTRLNQQENIVLVGTDEIAGLYIRAISTMTDARHKIVAVLDIDHAKVGRTLSGYKILGEYTIASALLDEMAIHGVKVDRFVVSSTLAGPESAPWMELSKICDERSIELDFLPDQFKLPMTSVPQLAADQPTLLPVVAPTRMARYWRVKRAIDIIASLAGILLASPLFILLGVVVAFSLRFPVVFWQERLGRYARPIRIHKFRTLLGPVDSKGLRRLESDRETPVGRVLRAYRLDELPQLFDILRGDMSLIGPRPLLPVDQPADARLRLSVRPGLTGWAQVHGGKSISPEEKNALDIWYINNASFLLDVKILLLSIKTVVFGDMKVDQYAPHSARARLRETGSAAKPS